MFKSKQTITTKNVNSNTSIFNVKWTQIFVQCETWSSSLLVLHIWRRSRHQGWKPNLQSSNQLNVASVPHKYGGKFAHKYGSKFAHVFTRVHCAGLGGYRFEYRSRQNFQIIDLGRVLCFFFYFFNETFALFVIIDIGLLCGALVRKILKRDSVGTIFQLWDYSMKSCSGYRP